MMSYSVTTQLQFRHNRISSYRLILRPHFSHCTVPILAKWGVPGNCIQMEPSFPWLSLAQTGCEDYPKKHRFATFILCLPTLYNCFSHAHDTTHDPETVHQSCNPQKKGAADPRTRLMTLCIYAKTQYQLALPF